jgi:hypothetical protein
MPIQPAGTKSCQSQGTAASMGVPMIAATHAAAKPYDANVPGMSLSGSVLIRFELSGVASGKRRNDVKVGMVQPHRLKLWDIASDEAPFHGGDESAPMFIRS